MGSELVTIVVPIYNVEKYLERCLNSIVNQTYRNLEIILVDDGSPDRCPEICNEWEKRDKRIKVIHKKNAGLGMARNTGIENATGKYICFFDSDDYIALDTIEKAYQSIKKYNADIVMFGMYSMDATGKIVSADVPRTDKEFYCDGEIRNFVLPNMMGNDPATGKKLGFNMSASGRMYSMNLITNYNWRFVSERKFISEDFYSLLELHQYVKRVSIINKAFYYYCYNNTSLTHSFNPQRFKKVCICHKGMEEVYKKCGYPEEVKVCLDSQFLGSVIATMKLLIMSSDMDSMSKWQGIKDIVTNVYLQEVLRQMNISNETVFRKIIILTLKHKLTMLTYFFVKVKTRN